MRIGSHASQGRAASLARIKREFGERVTLRGVIGVQHTLLHGTPAEVQAEVQERRHVLGQGGGYIAASAHYIKADAPLQNIIATYPAPRSAGPS